MPGGAASAGFFTPVGAGTLLAEGKEERVIDGVPHVLEEPDSRRRRRSSTRLARTSSATSGTGTPHATSTR